MMDLAAVQRRREFPARATQWLRAIAQKRVIGRVLTNTTQISSPLAVRILGGVPILRRVPARPLGLGFRPEHVSAPAAG